MKPQRCGDPAKPCDDRGASLLVGKRAVKITGGTDPLLPTPFCIGEASTAPLDCMPFADNQ
jgi:hypothetical protein